MEQGTGYRTLSEGQKVTYEVEPDPKNSEKLRAVNVNAVFISLPPKSSFLCKY